MMMMMMKEAFSRTLKTSVSPSCQFGPSLPAPTPIGRGRGSGRTSLPLPNNNNNNNNKNNKNSRRSGIVRVIRAVQGGPEGGHDPPAFESQMGIWMNKISLSENMSVDTTWDQNTAPFHVAYAVGVYGLMALAGQALCYFTGIDNLGGFNLSTSAVIQGLGYSILPMTALLFILDDEIVKISPPAQAIRDAEDEDLMSFFLGMSQWQFMFTVILASVAEELFFRIAIQGGLSLAFLSDGKINEATKGIASLTGIFPFFSPFAHVSAAVLTAALTGSIYFVAFSPQDPTLVVLPSARSRTAQIELKKIFTAWFEKRQLRQIYSPLLESFLALYLGLEWIQTGNILAPVITHIIYSMVVLGNGLRRIKTQRKG